jgi:tetratricopeptide (TPR) repeat protein
MKRFHKAFVLCCAALLIVSANHIFAAEMSVQAPEEQKASAMPAAAAGPSHLNKGVSFYQKGDYGSAIIEFNRALDENPQNVPAMINRGLSYAGRGDYKTAIWNLYSALNMQKDDVSILKYIAALYYLDGEFTKSMNIYGRAAALANTDFEIYVGRGYAWIALSQYAQAAEDFNRALFIAASGLRSHLGRAISLSAMSQYKAAVSDFGSAIAISDNPLLYLLRADTYARNYAYSNAISDLHKACSLGYTEVCDAIRQAKTELAGTEGSFVLQFSRKAPDEEFYETARKKLDSFYIDRLNAETKKFFVDMLKPAGV